MRVFFRRLMTVSLWPITDIVVTIFANIMLVRYGVLKATAVTAILSMSLNAALLYLLHFEGGLPTSFAAQVRQQGLMRFQTLSQVWGKTLAVLTAYVISGPAMVGAPLIWLLNIPKRRAYVMACGGALLNTLLWVGGVYNLLWLLVRTIVASL